MFRISLRELFVMVALVAAALASLVYATEPFRSVVSLFAMLLFIAATISAFVDRGARQAFAIGFALSMALYGGLLIVPPFGQRSQTYSPILDAHGGESEFGTTFLLRMLYATIVDETEVQISVMDVQGPTKMTVTERRFVPSPAGFMLLGHLWWALLFGYVGGRFGRFVYLRRVKEQPRSDERRD